MLKPCDESSLGGCKRISSFLYSYLLLQKLFLTILVLPFLIISAQKYNFNTWTLEDGLPQSQITTIYQDSKGYIWVGTNGGASKFNGITFKNFNNSDGLNSNIIHSINEDEKGNIWFAAGNSGVTKLDGGKFIVINKENGLINNTVNSIYTALDGKVWFGTDGGICVYDGEKFFYPEVNSDINYSRIFDIEKSAEGIVFSFEKGCVKYSDSRYKVITIDKKYYVNMVRSVYEDKTGNIWMGTFGSGVIKYDGKNFTQYVEPYYPVGTIVPSIISDDENRIHFASLGDGVSIYDGTDFKKIGEENGLIKNIIYCAYKDREGNIWYGSTGLIKRYGLAFEHYLFNDVPNPILQMSKDKNNNIWMCSLGGGVFNFTGNEFINYTTKDGLGSLFTRANLIDKEGNVWIGHFNGISIWEKNKFVPFDRFQNIFQDNRTEDIFLDSKNNYWISVYGKGVIKFNSAGWEIIDTTVGLPDNRVRDIYETEDGKIYFATVNGLAYYENDNIESSKVNKHLTNQLVLTLVEDYTNNLWVGTYGGGLIKYDPHKNSVDTINTKDGLNDNAVLSLLIEDDKNLWIGTNRGINKLDLFNYYRDTVDITSYSAAHGFRGIECNHQSILKDSKGNLWIGTVQGVTKFNPSKLDTQKTEPKTHITNIQLFFEDVDWSKFGEFAKSYEALPENLELPHNKNHLTFHFIGLTFDMPGAAKYRYRLKGFEDNYSPPVKTRQVTYSQLPPGEYTFSVFASNGNGLWNSDPTEFAFTIRAPYWQTWWFYSLLVLAVTATLIIAHRFRVISLERQQKELSRLVKERTTQLTEANEELQKLNNDKDKFFSIIAHDLKSPFQSLLGFSEYAATNKDELEEDELDEILQDINKSSKNLYALLENLLEWSRHKTGRMKFEPEKIDIKKLADQILKIYSFKASEKKIKLSNQIDKEIIVNADKDMTNAIIRNLVSNALKYTSKTGEVIIRAERKKSFAQISVSDDGVGMEEKELDKLFKIDIQFTKKGTRNEKGTGLGLILCKEFVEKNGGDIWVESKKGVGTTFYFTLPA